MMQSHVYKIVLSNCFSKATELVITFAFNQTPFLATTLKVIMKATAGFFLIDSESINPQFKNKIHSSGSNQNPFSRFKYTNTGRLDERPLENVPGSAKALERRKYIVHLISCIRPKLTH